MAEPLKSFCVPIVMPLYKPSSSSHSRSMGDFASIRMGTSTKLVQVPLSRSVSTGTAAGKSASEQVDTMDWSDDLEWADKLDSLLSSNPFRERKERGKNLADSDGSLQTSNTSSMTSDEPHQSLFSGVNPVQKKSHTTLRSMFAQGRAQSCKELSSVSESRNKRTSRSHHTRQGTQQRAHSRSRSYHGRVRNSHHDSSLSRSDHSVNAVRRRDKCSSKYQDPKLAATTPTRARTRTIKIDDIDDVPQSRWSSGESRSDTTLTVNDYIDRTNAATEKSTSRRGRSIHSRSACDLTALSVSKHTRSRSRKRLDRSDATKRSSRSSVIVESLRKIQSEHDLRSKEKAAKLAQKKSPSRRSPNKSNASNTAKKTAKHSPDKTSSIKQSLEDLWAEFSDPVFSPVDFEAPSKAVRAPTVAPIPAPARDNDTRRRSRSVPAPKVLPTIRLS